MTDTKNTALLVIDAQVNMFDPANPAFESDPLLKVINDLIQRARAAAVPVIFIRNNGGPEDPDLPNTPGWEIDPRLAPLAGERIVDKTRPDSFYETPLHTVLTERGIKNVVICGLQTDFCVNATTRRAAELGYKVTVATDGHSTYPSSKQTAAEIIQQHNADFAQIAAVVLASDIIRLL